MKIAIVDDDSAILESLVEYFKELGFEPIPFNCPSLAYKTILNADIYLLLADYQLGKTTGCDLIEKIKQDRPFMICMIMTANGYRDVLVEAMRAGAIDLIRKPFDLNSLEEMIMRAVSKLKKMTTIADMEHKMIKKAIAVCETEKEAAETLGINYTTLYRKKKAA